MTEETRNKIIQDAVDMGFLIEVCAGCGEPNTQESANFAGVKYKDCGCPAGTNLRWNSKVIAMWEKQVAIDDVVDAFAPKSSK